MAGCVSSGTKRAHLLNETDFECAICAELLLDPVVAPCGHDMCLDCLDKWTQCNKEANSSQLACPLCRLPLPPNLNVCFRLKRTIDQLYGPEVARRRSQMESRKAAEISKEALPPLSLEVSSPWSASAFHQALMVTAWHQQMLGFFHPYQAWYHLSSLNPPAAVSPSDSTSTGPQMGVPVMSHLLHQALMATAQYSQINTAAIPNPYANAVPDHDSRICCQHPATAVPPTAPVTLPSSSHISGNKRRCVSTNSPTTRDEAISNPHGSDNSELVLAPASPPPARSGSWHAPQDGDQRIQLARSILSYLRSNGLDTSLGPDKLPSAVRFLELSLYHQAPSMEAYLDPSTLEERIIGAIRERAAAVHRLKAAAREARHPESELLSDADESQCACTPALV